MATHDVKELLRTLVISEWKLYLTYDSIYPDTTITAMYLHSWAVLDELWSMLYPEEDYLDTKGGAK